MNDTADEGPLDGFITEMRETQEGLNESNKSNDESIDTFNHQCRPSSTGILNRMMMQHKPDIAQTSFSKGRNVLPQTSDIAIVTNIIVKHDEQLGVGQVLEHKIVVADTKQNIPCEVTASYHNRDLNKNSMIQISDECSDESDIRDTNKVDKCLVHRRVNSQGLKKSVIHQQDMFNRVMEENEKYETLRPTQPPISLKPSQKASHRINRSLIESEANPYDHIYDGKCADAQRDPIDNLNGISKTCLSWEQQWQILQSMSSGKFNTESSFMCHTV
jgi:hypothetical protein